MKTAIVKIYPYDFLNTFTFEVSEWPMIGFHVEARIPIEKIDEWNNTVDQFQEMQKELSDIFRGITNNHVERERE